MNGRIRLLTMALFMMVSCAVFAQKNFSISGYVTDNLTGKPLESKVFLMTEDSTVVDTMTTQTMYGSFGELAFYNMKALSKGKYIVRVTKTGYVDGYAHCNIWSNRQSQVWVNEVRLVKIMPTRNLPGVTVRATKVKMVMRGDTIIYNADAFNLADGSMLDALISRLPGTTLTRDGQIFVHGKKVESMLINGRDFFAGNLEIALQNLPAYIVDKVKVYNRSGWASRVTGLDKGDKEIVMDVALKREYAKNYIGNLEGGMGTAHRWIARGLGLKFSDKEQVVGFFNMNNLNNTDRSDIGGKWSSDDIASGLVATKTAGISYQNYLHGQFSQLSGNLSYTHTGVDNEERNATQTFLPMGDAWSTRVSKGTQKSDLLKGNFSVGLGAKNLNIRNQADFSYVDKKGWGNDVSQTSDSLSTLNRMLLSNSDEAHDFNLNFSTSYTYYILKMDILHWGFNMSYNNLSQKQYSLYDVDFLNSDSPRDYRNNYITSPNRDLKIGANLGYDYSLHAGTLSLSYQYQYAYNKAENMLYRLDKLAGRDSSRFDMLPSAADAMASVLDEGNSYTFHEYTNEHTLTPSFSKSNIGSNSGFVIAVPLRVVNSNLYYERQGRHDVFKNRLFVEPRLSVWNHNYFDWRIDASMHSALPALTSMVDYRDDSNPLYVRLGNGKLKDIHLYDVSLSLNRQGERQKIFDARLDFHQTDHAVAYALTFDKQAGRSTTKPVSVNGNWNAGLGTGYTAALDSAQRWMISNRLNVRYNHNVDMATVEGMTISQRSIVNNWTMGDDVSLNFRPSDGYEFTLYGGGNYYLIYSQRTGFADINAGDYHVGLNAFVSLPCHFQLSTDMTMYARRGYQQNEMNTTDWVWNAELTRSFVKGHLMAKLQGFDILRQLSTTSYAVNAQGRTETWHNSIPRYAMLSLSWRFNVNPKKKNAEE